MKFGSTWLHYKIPGRLAQPVLSFFFQSPLMEVAAKDRASWVKGKSWLFDNTRWEHWFQSAWDSKQPDLQSVSIHHITPAMHKYRHPNSTLNKHHLNTFSTGAPRNVCLCHEILGARTWTSESPTKDMLSARFPCRMLAKLPTTWNTTCHLVPESKSPWPCAGWKQ